MGGCLLSTKLYILWTSSRESRRAVEVTAYEILSIVITTIGLIVSVIALFLKLFAFLDSRYKRK